MVRVLIIDGSDRGGLLVYTRRLVASLEEQNADVFFVTGADASTGLRPYPRALWGHELDGYGRFRRKLERIVSTAKRALAIVWLMRKCKPDIVHLQTSLSFRADRLLAPLIRRKAVLVITVHNADPHSGTEREYAIESLRWRTADALIVHSQAARSLVAEAVGEVPIAVVSVDQLVDPPGISQSEARAALGLGSQPIVLLLGIVRSYKGISLMGEAWQHVREQDASFELHIVGHVAEESVTLDQLADSEGVHLHDGWIPEAELDQWAAAADVCVLPYEMGVHSGVLHRVVANGTRAIVSPSLRDEAARYSNIPSIGLDPELWVEAIVGYEQLGTPELVAPSLMGPMTVDFYEELCK